MNFTREPIIETVITPREGCKLVVRSSKGANQEDYFVDAVEVVSFGHSFFYRSLERPKSFLVPVSDYEILELKETRMVLKSATSDRSIKIGGGREAQMRREEPEHAERESSERPAMERKRDKRRRGRRGRDRDRERSEAKEAPREEPSYESEPEEPAIPYEVPEAAPEALPEEVPPFQEEEQKTPSFISKLFPPPSTLIKESLSRYKPVESSEEEDLFPPSSEEPVTFEEKTSFEESIFEHPIPENTDQEEQKNSEE